MIGIVFILLTGVLLGVLLAHYEFKKTAIREIKEEIKCWEKKSNCKTESVNSSVIGSLLELQEKINRI